MELSWGNDAKLKDQIWSYMVKYGHGQYICEVSLVDTIIMESSWGNDAKLKDQICSYMVKYGHGQYICEVSLLYAKNGVMMWKRCKV